MFNSLMHMQNNLPYGDYLKITCGYFILQCAKMKNHSLQMLFIRAQSWAPLIFSINH